MKTKQLYKSLLALAALWLTGNATATAGDVTTLYERSIANTEGITVWSDADKDGTSTDSWLGDYSNITIYDTGDYLGMELKAPLKTEKIITKSLSPSTGAILTFDFVWGYPYHNTYNQDGAYTNIKIGNNIEFINEKSAGSSYIINGTKTKYTGTLENTKVKIHVVVNTATFQLMDLTITKVSDESSLLSFASVPDELKTLTSETTFTQLSIGAKHTTNRNVDRYTRTIFESIKVQQETQDISSYGYTVKYKEGENVVKTVSGTLAEGAPIPVETAIDGDDNEHYLIAADELPTWTVSSTEADNVKEVAVRKPYSTTVNVYYVVGGVKDAEPVSTLNFTETDEKVANWEYYFPYYINRSGQWYKATLKNGTDFGETGTFNTTGGSMEKEVEYTLDADAVYFDESKWTGASGSSYITYSNGERSSKTGNQTYTYEGFELVAGTYEMIVPGTSYGTCTVKMGDTTIGTIPSGGGSFVFTKADDAAVNLIFTGNMRQLDYFLIKKASTVTVTIGETGYATYSNATAALDFSKASGLKAFAVKVNSDAIETTEVTAAIPANTGVLLQGDGGSYSVPVLSTTPEALTNNDLIATDGSAISKESGYVYYGLRQLSTGEVGFAKLGDFTPSAGKAYLKVDEATAARMSFFALGDSDTTGIGASLNDKGQMINDNVYDLQGRRVQQPQKGLYIVSGRKVVVK